MNKIAKIKKKIKKYFVLIVISKSKRKQSGVLIVG